MKNVLRATLGAGLAVASLTTPAAAAGDAVANQDLVYTVTASHKGGALEAGCVFRPDRWTADYGPTYIDGYAVSGLVVANNTAVTCRIYYNTTTLAASATEYANGNVALIQDARGGTTGTRGIRVCVEAWTQGIVDIGYSVSNCKSY